MLSQFSSGGLKSEMGSTGLKLRCPQGRFPLAAHGETVSWPLPASRIHCPPWLLATSGLPSSSLHLQVSPFLTLPPPSLTKTLEIHWAHVDNPGKSPGFKILNVVRAAAPLPLGEVT